jgi:hypothetical protein
VGEDELVGVDEVVGEDETDGEGSTDGAAVEVAGRGAAVACCTLVGRR